MRITEYNSTIVAMRTAQSQMSRVVDVSEVSFLPPSLSAHSIKPIKLTVMSIDGRIWALTFVMCCFEGTSFLVVFFWPSVLQDAHDQAHPSDGDDLPYGVIFASFMASMILGAVLFNALSRPGVLNRSSDHVDIMKSQNSAWAPVCLLMSAVAVAAVSLLGLSTLTGEATCFYSFLVFEVSNGVYVPSVAYLRGLVVDEKSRAGLYGLMKIPLFIFVILALGITAEGSCFPLAMLGVNVSKRPDFVNRLGW